MFGLEIYVAMAEAARQEEEHFRNAIKDLPFDQQQSLIKARQAEKEKAYREATEERRHRELCDAIRRSGCWWAL